MKRLLGWLGGEEEQPSETGSSPRSSQDPHHVGPLDDDFLLLDEREQPLRLREQRTPALSSPVHEARMVSREGLRKLRVTLFANGCRTGGKAMLVPPTETTDLSYFLRSAAKKLGMAEAKRVFTKDGGEIEHVEEINPEDVLYISSGEDFEDPLSREPTIATLEASSRPVPTQGITDSCGGMAKLLKAYDDGDGQSIGGAEPAHMYAAKRRGFGDSSGDDFLGTSQKTQVTDSSENLTPEEYERYRKCLKTYFGYSSFRPLQVKVIQACLAGRDAFLCMATGAGKSLCYQLPALLTQKVVIVVCPLISLMVDQVLALQQANVKACFLGSAQTDSTVEHDACEGKYNLVYMAPEKIVLFKRQLEFLAGRKLLALLAIDEVHCVSEWGHDFRPDYREIGKVRTWIPTVPVLALTGTATANVQADVLSSLSLRDPLIAKSSFARPNLYFSVMMKSHDVAADLKKLLFPSSSAASINSLLLRGSVIVYCRTIKETESVAEVVQGMGIRAEAYHANMGLSARKEVHKRFVTDQTEVVVATVAFGMGIDKPDVRKVIHYGPPKSLEEYYQQAGRAGRDGLAASCHLLYTPADFSNFRFFRGSGTLRTERTKMLGVVSAYALTTSCRQQFLLKHFEEEAPECKNCDNCLQLPAEKRDFTDEALLLLRTIDLTGGKFGFSMVIEVLRGSKSAKVLERNFDRLATHGMGKDYSKDWWTSLSRQLLHEGYIVEKIQDLYRTYSLSQKGLKLIMTGVDAGGGQRLVLPIPAEMQKEANHLAQKMNRTRQAANQRKPMDKDTEDLFSHLINTNKNEAHRRGLAPYMVIPTVVLETLARLRPTKLDSFRAVEGIDRQKALNYASIFTTAIQQFCQHRRMTTDLPDSSQSLALESSTTSGTKRTAEGVEKMTQAKWEIYRMYETQKMSIAAICAARNIKSGTVLSYLGTAIENGYPVEWSRLGISEEEYNMVVEAIDALSPTAKQAALGIRAIKERLPDPTVTDFGTVRIVQARYMAARSNSSAVRKNTAPTGAISSFTYQPPSSFGTSTAPYSAPPSSSPSPSPSSSLPANPSRGSAQSVMPARGVKFTRHAGNKIGPSPDASPVKQAAACNQELVRHDAKKRRLEASSLPTHEEPAIASAPALPEARKLSEGNLLATIKDTGGCTRLELLRFFSQNRAPEVDVLLESMQEGYLIYLHSDGRFRPL